MTQNPPQPRGFSLKERNMQNKTIIIISFFILTASTLCFAIICHSAKPQLPTYTAKVSRVIDGDTIHVKDAEGKLHKIRLAMLDAPEKMQPYGNIATQKLKDLVLYQTVEIKVKCIDKYQREVAYVFCKEKDISAELLKQGMAMHYHLLRDNCQAYDTCEKEAKAQKLGIWQQKKIEPPWDYRRRMKISNCAEHP